MSALFVPLHGDMPMGAGGSTLDAGMVLMVMAMGAFHGINPGMGWLFAVSYGLQQKSRKALLRSLLPIAIGHELSVLPIALAITLFASEVQRAVVLTVFAVGLTAFGFYLLLRKRHFRWVGMKLTPPQLAWWSFLMSTVTGAGLMLAPVLLHHGGGHDDHLLSHALGGELSVAGLLAIGHGLAMLVTAGVVALLVYQVFGLRILRTAWINLDKIWAVAFVGAGIFVWIG